MVGVKFGLVRPSPGDWIRNHPGQDAGLVDPMPPVASACSGPQKQNNGVRKQGAASAMGLMRLPGRLASSTPRVDSLLAGRRPFLVVGGPLLIREGPTALGGSRAPLMASRRQRRATAAPFLRSLANLLRAVSVRLALLTLR